MEGDRSGVLGTVRGGTRLGTDQLRVVPSDYRLRMVCVPELANASCRDHDHVLTLAPPCAPDEIGSARVNLPVMAFRQETQKSPRPINSRGE